MKFLCSFFISLLSIFVLVLYANINVQETLKMLIVTNHNLSNSYLHPFNKTHNEFNDLFNLTEVQKDEIILYELCMKIQKNFREILKNLVYDMRLTTNQKIWLNIASLKSLTSFRRKLVFFRSVKLELIDDIVRGSIIFESEKAMYVFRDKLKNYYNIHAQHNNFRNNKRYKAFFLKLSDKFAEKFKNYFVLIELQLHFCGTYLVQKYTHNLYKILRNLKALTSKNVILEDIDLGDLANSIHPYFIVKSLSDKCLNSPCKISRKEIILKENKYLLKKTMSDFDQIDFLRDYSEYSKNLLLEYKHYESSFHNTTSIENHKALEHFLEKFLTDIYKTALIDKNKCDYNTLDTIEFYS